MTVRLGEDSDDTDTVTERRITVSSADRDAVTAECTDMVDRSLAHRNGRAAPSLRSLVPLAHEDPPTGAAETELGRGPRAPLVDFVHSLPRADRNTAVARDVTRSVRVTHARG
jgi:hypothetical protein